MNNIQYELDYLCGLFELYMDDQDRARNVARMVCAEAFTIEGAADALVAISETLGKHVAPKISDLQAHERWKSCRDLIIDVARIGADSRCAFSLGVDRFAWHVNAAYRRRLVDLAGQRLQLAISDARSSSADIAAASKAVMEAAENVQGGEKPTTLSDAILEWGNAESTPVVETGFLAFDSMSGGGLPIGGLTVIAAPPSVGKSALALQLVLGALELDRSLLAVWGLGEMTMDSFARRAICNWSNRGTGQPVSMSGAERRTDIAKGSAAALAAIVGDRLRLVPPPLSMQRLEDAVVASRSRLLVVDYVQLVEMDGANDRRSEVDGVVKRIRRLSLEHNVAVLAVSNVAKIVSAETRIGAIGKESSELDFAADLLLLGVPDEREDHDGTRFVRWACKKNRHGECRDIETSFDGRLQTFTDAQSAIHDEFRPGAW